MKPYKKIEILIDRALSLKNKGRLSAWNTGFLSDIHKILKRSKSPETALSMKQKQKVYSILKEAGISIYVDQS